MQRETRPRRSAAPLVWLPPLALLLCGAAAAQVEDAARAFETEAARLEEAVEATDAVWAEQDSLVRALLDETRALESSYGDADSTPAELRALEDRVEAALEAACKQARETIASRRRVYDEMDRLAELARKVDAERRAIFDAPIPGGVWRLEIAGSDLVGIMRLEVEGATVRGSYRLSNGRAGSVSGTYGAGVLDLTRFDAASGRDAVLRAAVDEAQQTLEGEWVRFELAAGEPGSGRWSATRVADEDELDDLGSPR